MVPADMDWDDVGSWSVFERRLPHDVHGNVTKGNHIFFETEGCIIVSGEGDLVATLGVRNLAVIHGGDVVLVADKSREQDVKRLVEICKRDQSLAGYL
jgi:mannose-1-phosphate guanylyltransferase